MTRYKFKGYTITNCGYHQPDHCVWWEACNDDGLACFHGTTLREVEFLILESEWEDKLRAKEREVAELQRRLNVAEDALESVIDNCDVGYDLITTIRNALDAIREEGGRDDK